MHLEKAIAVARKELKWECDYIREANNQVPLVGQILRDRSPGAAAL
jgi:predicted unusual protein kinase regulating ubiquinone biosynthesis (AarF/ABC1/UbiB family)